MSLLHLTLQFSPSLEDEYSNLVNYLIRLADRMFDGSNSNLSSFGNLVIEHLSYAL